MKRAAVAGLDGVTWNVLDPLIADGVMPRLALLREKGSSGILQSTVPTYTPPAWTSAATGVNPGRHGIYGFFDGHAQHEKQNLVHSGRVKATTLWEMVAEQNARAGIYHLPLTYPPQPVEGWMVSGMMTPGWKEQASGFATWSNPGGGEQLEKQILEWSPGYVLDISANWEQDWRDDALANRVVDSLEQRKIVLSKLLELDPPRVLFSVQESPDRLMHVYYRYLDPHEMRDTPEAKKVRPALEKCFGLMDDIVGMLDDWAGDDGGVLVVSDHGFTAWEVSVHTNALLEKWGYLKMRRAARVMQTKAARSMVPLAKRILPAKVASGAKDRTFAAIDWSQTRAFASPIPQQGIFINLEGREPKGIVPPGELAKLKDEITQRFLDLTDESGTRLTDKVWRSEEVFHGEALDGAPDILPVLRDHRYELDDEVFHRDPFTDLRHLPRGVHHPDGVVVISGNGVRAGEEVAGSVLDVTPTLLYMAGLKVPEGLDGRVLEDAFTPSHLQDRPVETTAALSSRQRDESSPYSAEEEAQIEESLRGLGYL
jgi:predicted AlkP superfamily phosphohydrolase/phosphomutase